MQAVSGELGVVVLSPESKSASLSWWSFHLHKVGMLPPSFWRAPIAEVPDTIVSTMLHTSLGTVTKQQRPLPPTSSHTLSSALPAK